MPSTRAIAARSVVSAVAVVLLAGCGPVATKASCADFSGKLGDAAQEIKAAGGDQHKLAQASRDFAQELRTRAQGAYSAEVRDAMNRLAADYEALGRADSLTGPDVAKTMGQLQADTQSLIQLCN